MRVANLVNAFSFMFAWSFPFLLYVTLVNLMVDDVRAARLPASPLVLLGYLALLASSYAWVTWRAFRRFAESA